MYWYSSTYTCTYLTMVDSCTTGTRVRVPVLVLYCTRVESARQWHCAGTRHTMPGMVTLLLIHCTAFWWCWHRVNARTEVVQQQKQSHRSTGATTTCFRDKRERGARFDKCQLGCGYVLRVGPGELVPLANLVYNLKQNIYIKVGLVRNPLP